MKFKYLEQHAKLDLMHNLTGEEGKILEQGENEDKGEPDLTDGRQSNLIILSEERTNAKKKAALKANKVHLEELRAEALKLSHEVSSCALIAMDRNTEPLIRLLCTAHREVAESVGEVNNYMKKVKEMEHELARIRGVHPVKDVSQLNPATESSADFHHIAHHRVSS